MAYEVLARKWRPQLFDDVVGQKHVTATLCNAIESDRLAHAYLFVGPRGIGKTSIARIFAKALNCVEGPTVKPCGKCDPCREIASGSSLDVLEIDGASNNGVEQVRDLRDSVMYAPAHGKFKIYIIDEVHMLSNAAFNALLKTLEEPPPHVKFIFATTEPDKILTTIISRCQRFDLKRIPVTDIVERLELIAKAEKVSVSDDALIAVARGAEGGLRDAESALDQLIAFRGNKIEEEDVLSVFGLVSRTGLESLAEAVLKGDLKSVIKLVGQFDAAGKDLSRLLAELVEHFRNVLIALNVDKIDEVLDVTSAQKEVMQRHGAMTDTTKLLRAMGVLSGAADRLKFALSQRTLLETALIRAGRVATAVSLEDVLKEINVLKAGGGELLKKKAEPDGLAARAAEEEVPAGARSDTEGPQTRVEAQKPVDKPVAADERVVIPQTHSSEGDLTVGTVLGKWQAIIDKVGLISVAARSGLADARPVRVDDETVVIGFEAEFAHEIDRFKNLRNRKAVEKALERELGRSVGVIFEVVADAGRMVVKEAPVELPAGKDGKTQSKQEDPGSRKNTRDLIADPVVQKVMEMFDGSILEVRD